MILMQPHALVEATDCSLTEMERSGWQHQEFRPDKYGTNARYALKYRIGEMALLECYRLENVIPKSGGAVLRRLPEYDTGKFLYRCQSGVVRHVHMKREMGDVVPLRIAYINKTDDTVYFGCFQLIFSSPLYFFAFFKSNFFYFTRPLISSGEPERFFINHQTGRRRKDVKLENFQL